MSSFTRKSDAFYILSVLGFLVAFGLRASGHTEVSRFVAILGALLFIAFRIIIAKD